MKDLKTTVTGAVGGAAAIAASFGFGMPSEVVTGIIAVTVFLIGLFSADSQAAP